MINITICDNDLDYLKSIEKFLSEHISHSPYGNMPITIKSFSSPTEIMSLPPELRPDILILDIHMPEKNGLDVAEAFKSSSPETRIIFLTNYEQFVFYSLRFSPFRFIRKSKMAEELPEAIDSAIRSLSSCAKGLIINKYSDYEIIPLNSIKYIAKVKFKNFVSIFCTNRTVEYGDTILSMEKRLDSSEFVKINSGTLVNMKFVKCLSKQQIILTDGTILTVALSRLDDFKRELSLYQRFDF